MATRCPYSFPARSRAAMISAIRDISRPYTDWNRTFLFSWNVKHYGALPMTAAELDPFHYEGGAFDPKLDSAWEAESSAESDSRWQWLLEDLQRPYIDGEYSTWPGDDAGQFRFGFYGRQGGHLCLESIYGHKPVTGRGGYLCDMPDIEELPFPELRRLYRALVVMDSDFARPKVAEAFAWSWAFQRFQWEEEKREERESANAAYAAAMMESRPDMHAPA